MLQALSVMAALYASVLGTTVIRHKGLPLRPSEWDGVMIIDAGRAAGSSQPFGIGPELEAALRKRGELSGPVERMSGPGEEQLWRATFVEHVAAEAAVEALGANTPAELRGCSFFLGYNERPYHLRGYYTGVEPVTCLPCCCRIPC